ncbi:hypothetical protein LTR13_007533 [Exophiala sideris]|uniref:SANT domain-containing protein n=1 Tax=Exophiala sideris TaxID=1016849 RepID=A0ABR0J7I2_9EURO|nr:hypothetical protein LTR13_007533 [Exophiala sideris]KAK5058221.1 hypothetical protein LTR69_006625 [Exophiala sideris]KAK5180151.1 hypothetical protein LTR44_007276 [Eurotiomycetes sp. CCFEE 6388]
MSSRYPPPARDRSPPRYDRRPSGTYNAGGSSYRGQADSAQLPSERAPPRGPKADFGRGGFSQFSPAPRGRGGFTARTGDTWDRDRDRDARPVAQSYRGGRDDDRPEWSRRDRDFGTADRGREPRSYVARDRSASPVRARRDSRESVPSTFGRLADTASSYYVPPARGGLGRGRGRGDWDRSRGRSSFVGERDRDLFQPRSRSRESWRDRERDFDRGRPAGSDADRFERRGFERSKEREGRTRDREHDIWPRDPSPIKSSVANTGAPIAASSLTADRAPKFDSDAGRRSSVVATPTGALRDNRRDGEPSDYFGTRTDTARRDQPPSAQQPSAAAGLDYGPPPSVPSATTPASEKPAQAKPPAPKTETGASSSSTFQPPSAPKAARTSMLTSLIQSSKATQNESSSRPEPIARSVRPSQPSDVVTKEEEPPIELKPPAAPAADRQMPPNVPSGPRLGNAPPYKPRLPSIEPASPAQPPSAPREVPKPQPLDSRSPSIPTGPRLDREGSRPLPGTGSKIWVSPDYKPKPSIMNTMNKAYQPEPRDRLGSIPTGPRGQQIPFHNSAEKSRGLPPTYSSITSAPLGPKPSVQTSPRIETKITLLPQKRSFEMRQHPEDVEMSAPASSEDEDEEEEEEAEDDSFDEDYFAESEERFRQELELLEARKPPPILEDATIVSLLFKLQFLEMIMQENDPMPVRSPVQASIEQIPAPKSDPTGLPSPEQAPQEIDNKIEDKEEEEIAPAHPKGRPLKQAPVNPIPTPPIEDLPYLKAETPERDVFEDSDNEIEHEAVAILLQQEFERSAWDWRSDLEDMRGEFRRKYPIWKQEVIQLEHERRDVQASPAPASPAPSAAPSVTPSLSHERTRGARNTTEADLQAAILMSQQSLREEEERREREAASSSLPNYDTEAVVPPMLKPADVELSEFKDTNRRVSKELAIDVFAYVPPEDDFTEEEQKLFITAYCQTPKKWGKIAEAIPGRTYQDCIVHYYLTKNQAHYKDIWRRSQPRKKRGRTANKPRSNALLVYGDDGEVAPVPVTDSGRPRRAAAPTFGDAPSEVDSSTPVPQSKKLASASKDGSAEPAATKPARGRKAGIATKTRRTKAQIQADQQALLLSGAEATSDKPVVGVKGEKARPLPRPETVATRNDVPALEQIPRPPDTLLPQHPGSEMSAAAQMANPAASQVTSYWSVPEQHKFPELLAYYGRDFAAIADFMKTKSVTMIKNYYLRQINDGKGDFERIAQMGDQVRMEGKTLGQPPSPIAPAKRRYEATPAVPSITRPIHQNEHSFVESEPAAHVIKPGVIEEFPRNTIERNASGEIVSKPRVIGREGIREAPLPGMVSAKSEEVSRYPAERSSLYVPKPLHGPRAGLFQEEPVGIPSGRQNLRPSIDERSPQLHPQRPLADLPRNELNQPSPASGIGQSILAQRERETVAQPQSQIPSMSLARGAPMQVDKYGPQQPVFRPGHSRNGSLATSRPGSSEPPRDLASLRRLDNQRSLYSGLGATASPATIPAAIPASQHSRPEVLQPAATPLASEPPKPPSKRSNLFGLLNDDPSDPPPKRPSLEAPRRQPVLSPQVVPVDAPRSMLQQSSGQMLPGEAGANRPSLMGPYRPPSGSMHHTASGQPPPTDYHGGFSTTPAKDPNDPWMARFDPRNQGGPVEQRAQLHSPAPSLYSVVPPGSQPNSAGSLHPGRAETPRGFDRGGLDHRRTFLGGIAQIPHAPSPPPQQASQNMQQYRSASGSSQHSRVSSVTYPAGPGSSQAAALNQQQMPQSLPPSASSTPVPSLHQRTQSSAEYPQRLTIQQHMAQQSQAKQQEQQREHERQIQRQMDVDMAQREREREREHQQQHHQQQQQHLLRRDPYGVDQHLAGGASRQNQMSGLVVVQWDTDIACRNNINTNISTSTSSKLDRVRTSRGVQIHLVPIRCIISINSMASIPDLLVIIGG